MTPVRRVLLAILAGIALLGTTSPRARAEEPKLFFTIGTASVDGLYSSVGQAVCRLLIRLAGEKPGVARTETLRCYTQPTGGSEDNVNRLATGQVDFAVVQSDVANAAYHGSSPDTVRPLAKLRAVFSLQAEPFQLVVGKDSNINSFADLRGKRVNIGSPGSGERVMMDALMERYHLKASDFAKVSESPASRQAAALCEGTIDAFVFVAGIPDGGVARATDECGAHLVPVQDRPALALAAEVPGVELVKIPKRTYTTTSSDVPTVGVIATLVTTADEDPDMVYLLTKTVMENLNEIRGFSPALAGLKEAAMISDGITIPLHPGAIRYYQERGWLKGKPAVSSSN